MLKNYLIIAWRQLQKNKLFASINTLGLVVGLTVYVFGSLLVDYENNYDRHWKKADRIYTVGTLFAPEANIGLTQNDGIYTAFTPFIEADIEELEAVARSVGHEFLVSIGDDHYYQKVRFVDPAFVDILDFDYIEGNDRVLDDPSSIIVTASAAEKFFGQDGALGRTVTLDHSVGLRVGAVIAELPSNNHISGGLLAEDPLTIIAPLEALNKAIGYDLAGDFGNLSTGDLTYVLLPKGKDQAWLQANIDGVFERHFPGRERDFISGLKVRPISEVNTYIWDAIGLPILDSVGLLAFLVLVVAIVNYTNLATAQSLGRSREIGLRKTMGATRAQLVAQFLVESLSIAALAMLLSIALLELIIPLFNSSLDRELTLSYLDLLPWLGITTCAVGLVAGAYPALLITRANPIAALRDSASGSPKSSRFRSAMLILQFSISVFMLAMVFVVYSQNRKIEEVSNIYPKSEVLTLHRLNIDSILERRQTLTEQWSKLPNVAGVSFSSVLPYVQSNSTFTVGATAGERDQSFMLNQVKIDENFFDVYDIPLTAGRPLNNQSSDDTLRKGMLNLNVVVNELAARKLGFGDAQEAIGRVFYDFPESRATRSYRIVGVTPNQNFQGFHNQIKPTTFIKSESDFRFASIRIRNGELARALTDVSNTWENLVTDYPIQPVFLEEEFNRGFEVYKGISLVMGGFAFLALFLSMIGLFGLAAFMAATRTKEIGIRKVMGASNWQIVRLLVWQFSQPVLWAMLFALPLAFLASNQFLQFFADRIDGTAVIVIGAGLLGLLFSWFVVGVHAVRIAKANPISALRYE